MKMLDEIKSQNYVEKTPEPMFFTELVLNVERKEIIQESSSDEDEDDEDEDEENDDEKDTVNTSIKLPEKCIFTLNMSFVENNINS